MMADKILCRTCNLENERESIFCFNCGKKFGIQFTNDEDLKEKNKNVKELLKLEDSITSLASFGTLLKELKDPPWYKMIKWSFIYTLGIVLMIVSLFLMVIL